MTRSTKRGGQVWIKIFPDKPVTAKPAETRMGSGKGAPEYWVAVVKPGRVLFEIGGIGEEAAREALRLAAPTLPSKTKIITHRSEGEEERAVQPALPAGDRSAGEHGCDRRVPQGHRASEDDHASARAREEGVTEGGN